MTVPLLHVAACWALTAAEQTTPGDCSFLQHGLQLQDARGLGGAFKGVESYSLFVKFHKVAGTTWRSYVDWMTGETNECSRDCGYPTWDCHQYWPTDEASFERCCEWPFQNISCPGRARSCTYHQSLAVMRQAVSGKDLRIASQDLTDPQNLWPSTARLQLLQTVEWARAWLPPNLYHKRILVTTLLREPVEKIRSYYYFTNSVSSHEGFKAFLEFRRDFVMGNWTQQQFDNQSSLEDRGASSMSILLRSCCEYETWLGDGSVEKAKLTLATQFDLVGITERMSEGLVTLGKLYGLTVQQLAAVGQSIPRELENSDNKLDWTDEELRLATVVAQKSSEVYTFAQQLFERQYLNLFGSEENMQAAVAAFHELDPDD